ncbi:hypothetical protein [Microbacterium sp. 69-10]|uniref:hypothetical protein n=1 Tax=Microbacterium sp. 69-10 TaxID=1895783 RepID=UPI0025D379E7|nr:hypothetical protein [Microbacterium sp. 69-10]
MNHEPDDAAPPEGTRPVPGPAAPEQRDHTRLGHEVEPVPPPDGDDATEAPEVQAELIELIERGEIQLTRSENYSGLIPHPAHWERFDPETRERILRMSEAFTTDESRRRDQLVDAEISESRNGRRNAFLIMGGSLIAALTSVLTLQNGIGVTAAGIFLAVPVATVIRDFIRGRNGGG